MKDELGGKIMTEFVALRPKLYSYKKLDGSEEKKCKGIKKCVVKKTLTFEDHKACLFNDSTEYRSQLMFRSAKHEVHTIKVNKVSLNRDDDKRISRKDGISTFARGHKDLSWSPLCRYQFDRLPFPGHPGAFAPNCVPSPRAFAQQKMPKAGPINDNVPGARHLHQHKEC